MKINKIILISAVAAMLAAGCGKEAAGDGFLKLFAERMDGGNSKVLVDPNDVSGASWVADEQIDLNGVKCTIKGDGDAFYLDGVTPLNSTMYAVYPAAINADGNHIAVSNNGATACGVNIHSLSVEFVDDNTQKVVFPMAAKAAANSRGLKFRHLTGGIRLTLKNTKADADLNVARLVVTATTASHEPAIYKDLCPTEDGWTPSLLPAIPSGEVGSINGDQDVRFISDMTLFLKDGSNNYKTITRDNGTITFCMPLLAREVKYLTVTGYSSTGTELFSKEKTLETPTAIQRNVMYDIPIIELR
jgi:hypothetical protein